MQNNLQRYTIHYITYRLLILLLTQYYITFSSTFAHTEREKKEQKGKGRTTYYICTLCYDNNKIKVTKILVLVDLLTFEPLK